MHTQSAGLREFLPDASPTRVDLAPRDVQASGAERGGDTTLAQSEIPGPRRSTSCARHESGARTATYLAVHKIWCDPRAT